MPTTPEQIAELISGYTDLKEYFENARDTIDADRARMRSDLQAHIDTANQRIPLPPNLIQNAFMTEVDEPVGTQPARPVGFSSNGFTIEAVHPYTQGFEGPYIAERPTNAVDNPNQATQANPFWYGRYNMGPRSGRGGLAHGWSGITNGHILRVTASASTQGEHRMLRFSPVRLGALDRLWFRCYVKIVSGSRLGFGVDAGYSGVIRGHVVTKAEADTSNQGWHKIDRLISTSRVTGAVGGNNFTVGGSSSEALEFYIALPYAFIPFNAQMGIIE